MIVDAEPGEASPVGSRSLWVLMRRAPGYFESRGLGAPLASWFDARPPIRWTDDFNNLVDVFVFK